MLVRCQSVSDSSQCVYPCKCPNDPPRCKTSRTIKDGCDCCHICPRQQGDLCDQRDKCDEDRGLHCDFMLDDGHRGICRGQSHVHALLCTSPITLTVLVHVPYWLFVPWRQTDRLRTFENFAKLGLCTLELRRLHLDLIYCYKSVLGLVHVDIDHFFTFSTATNKYTRPQI